MERLLWRDRAVLAVLCLVCIIMLGGCSISSHRYVVVDPPTASLKSYRVLEVKQVRSNLQEDEARGVADELSRMIVDSISEYNRKHPDAALLSATSASDETDQVLVMKSVLLSYEKGSRAARYFLGIGAGKAYCTIQSSFADKKTDRQILRANFEGELTAGPFGGSAKHSAREVVEAITDYLRKNY